VKWNGRLTRTAGLTTSTGRALLAVECVVSLSTPLLRLRKARDMVETLLHEMIHAYLSVTRKGDGESSHGPLFMAYMYQINARTGFNLTVRHSFHDEVNHYLNQHIWRCDGICKSLRPKYGYIRRARDRAPAPSDFGWKRHAAECGGTYHKVPIESVPDFILGK
jgi:predicted SprT family Zn-dependent metalloprotease